MHTENVARGKNEIFQKIRRHLTSREGKSSPGGGGGGGGKREECPPSPPLNSIMIYIYIYSGTSLTYLLQLGHSPLPGQL